MKIDDRIKIVVRSRFILGITLAVSSVSTSLGQTSAPLRDAAAMPEAPKQKQIFAAPTNSKLPDSFIAAAIALFEMGLADPRGCEYRECRVVRGDGMCRDGEIMSVHAWVFQAEARQKGATAWFAVAWNGLIYPAISVGDKADLRADVNLALRDDKTAADSWRKRFSENYYADRFAGAVAKR